MAGIDFIYQNNTKYEIVPEIAPLFETTKAYAIGDHVIYEAEWYTFKEAKTAGAWDATKVDGPFKVTNRISELKEDLTHAFPHDTVSGAVASFTDGADDVPMDSVIVSIEPVQSGNGDPSPDNVRPISGWSEVNVSACGINIWDEEWEVGGISSADGSKYNDNARIRSKNFISVEPSTQYYFAMPAALSHFKVVFYKQDKTFLSYSSYKNAVFTTPSDCYWLMLSENATDYGATYNHDISINYPSTDHEYHAYSGQSITISLGQTVYGGTLDVTKGVLTVDRAMVDLNSATWSSMDDIANCFSCGIKVDASIPNYPNVVCDTYVGGINYNDVRNNNGKIGINRDRTILHDNRFSTPSEFNTYLQTHSITFVYPIPPITITLTPHEVRSLLGSNNVWADTGDSTVEYRADPTLYISRLTEPDADMIADANITSGSYFMVGNTLYKATANIASGATISPNVNCVRKSLSEALNEINA